MFTNRHILSLLPYSIHSYSSYSSSYHPSNIKTDSPHDPTSRWSSSSNDQKQYLILELPYPSIICTVTFGKFSKIHVCNVKELKVYTKGCDVGGVVEGISNNSNSNTYDTNNNNTNNTLGNNTVNNTPNPTINNTPFIEVLHTTLHNDTEKETFILNVIRNNTFIISKYVKIVPLQAWGMNFNYSVWYVALHGICDVRSVIPIHDMYRDYQATRYVLKYLLKKRNEYIVERGVIDKSSKLVGVSNIDSSNSILEGVIDKSINNSKLEGGVEGGVNNIDSRLECDNSNSKLEGVNNSIDTQQGVNNIDSKLEGVNTLHSKQQSVNTLHNIQQGVTTNNTNLSPYNPTTNNINPYTHISLYSLLSTVSGVNLQHPLLTSIHTLLSKGCYEEVEHIIINITDISYFNEYLRITPYNIIWNKVRHIEPWPSIRGGHHAVIHDSVIYMYGGWNGTQELSDMWRYECYSNNSSSNKSGDIEGIEGFNIGCSSKSVNMGCGNNSSDKNSSVNKSSSDNTTANTNTVNNTTNNTTVNTTVNTTPYINTPLSLHSPWSLLSNNTRSQNGPGRRSCHKMCVNPINNTIYVLGRYLPTEYQRESSWLSSDMYIYDIKNNTWEVECDVKGFSNRGCELQGVNNITNTQQGVSNSSSNNTTNISNIGNINNNISNSNTSTNTINNNISTNNNTYTTNISNNTYTTPHINNTYTTTSHTTPHINNRPDNIYDHQMSFYNNITPSFFIYGGRAMFNETQTYSGLYNYDINNKEWTCVRSDVEQPCYTPLLRGRVGHTLIHVPVGYSSRVEGVSNSTNTGSSVKGVNNKDSIKGIEGVTTNTNILEGVNNSTNIHRGVNTDNSNNRTNNNIDNNSTNYNIDNNTSHSLPNHSTTTLSSHFIPYGPVYKAIKLLPSDYDNTLIIIGGQRGKEVFKDMTFYKIDTDTIYDIIDIPYINTDDRIVIRGVLNKKGEIVLLVSNFKEGVIDVYVYNMYERKWSISDKGDNRDMGVNDSSSNNKVLDNSISNNPYTTTTSNNTYSTTSNNTPLTIPQARTAHVFLYNECSDTYYLYGGNINTENGDKRVSDMWVMNMYKIGIEGIKRRIIFIIRKYRFMVLLQYNLEMALSYLQNEVCKCVDHGDRDMERDFQRLCCEIYCEGRRSSVDDVVCEIGEYFNESMCMPRGSIEDNV